MIKSLFYNPNANDYQAVRQALLKAGIEFDTFPVTGRNVAERLKRIGINGLPALYVRDSRNVKIFIGQEIMDLVGKQEVESESEENDVPFRYRAKQTYARPTKTKKKEPEPESESEEIQSGSEEAESLSIIESSNEEIQSKDLPLENDKGKINASAAMKAFQAENEKLLPPEDERPRKRIK